MYHCDGRMVVQVAALCVAHSGEREVVRCANIPLSHVLGGCRFSLLSLSNIQFQGWGGYLGHFTRASFSKP